MDFLICSFLFILLNIELADFVSASSANSVNSSAQSLQPSSQSSMIDYESISIEGTKPRRLKRETTENKRLLLNRLLREADDLFRTYRRKPSATCSTGGRKPIGMDLWCPRMNQLKSGRQAWTCVNSKSMCDDRYTCPLSEDEDPIHCMFFRAAHIRLSEIKSLIVDVLTHSRKSRTGQDFEQLKNNLLLI